MANIISFSPNRAADLNGFAVPSARAYFYDAGTSNLRVVYSDPACEVPHPSPLVADGAGVFAPVYDASDGDVKVIVQTPEGVALAGYPLELARVVGTDATGAAGIQFQPTEEIPETNVQAAIERVQANSIDPLADYGLGVTGNATLLPSIDATDIASGFYRYDGTTEGTFPSGVDKNDGGIVLLFRRTAFEAVMLLFRDAQAKTYRRRLSGAWSTWSFLISSTDTATNGAWIAGVSTEPAAISPATLKTVLGSDDRQWTDVTASRSRDVTYQNTTGRTIQVILNVGANRSGTVSAGASAGSLIPIYDIGDWDSWPVTFDVPPGHFYRLTATAAHNRWVELR